MILNSRKIVFNLIFALSFTCIATIHAMETFKQGALQVANQVISNEPLKIATATFAGLCAYDAMKILFVQKKILQKPFNLQECLQALKSYVLPNLIYGTITAAVCRAGSRSSLTLSDLTEPVAKASLITTAFAMLTTSLAYILPDNDGKKKIESMFANGGLNITIRSKFDYLLIIAFSIMTTGKNICLLYLPAHLYFSRNKTC